MILIHYQAELWDFFPLQTLMGSGFVPLFQGDEGGMERAGD